MHLVWRLCERVILKICYNDPRLLLTARLPGLESWKVESIYRRNFGQGPIQISSLWYTTRTLICKNTQFIWIHAIHLRLCVDTLIFSTINAWTPQSSCKCTIKTLVCIYVQYLHSKLHEYFLFKMFNSNGPISNVCPGIWFHFSKDPGFNWYHTLQNNICTGVCYPRPRVDLEMENTYWL